MREEKNFRIEKPVVFRTLDQQFNINASVVWINLDIQIEIYRKEYLKSKMPYKNESQRTTSDVTILKCALK